MELNHFKHENNLHQKKLNLKNHDLNSRIISELMSGLKSDIEYFRWSLTRSGILAVLTMATAIIIGWTATRNLKFEQAAAEAELDKQGPVLKVVNDNSDEESHDYEADWDENVNVQVLSQLINKDVEK
ncbi:unnamed protein product [Ambrosiozyma monospora]|uniref:Unnamed protein product n=1 Tax=Ambrosiozyma monospora TaxID=43982 RepID=A0ACB5U9Z4_AMBMO|nr:unnamed protein product [Ambrosiozyma monospora]